MGALIGIADAVALFDDDCSGDERRSEGDTTEDEGSAKSSRFIGSFEGGASPDELTLLSVEEPGSSFEASLGRKI